jgi:hypothetical protein
LLNDECDVLETQRRSRAATHVRDHFGKQGVRVRVLRNRLCLVAGLPELLTACEMLAHSVEDGQSNRNVVLNLADKGGIVVRGFVVLEHE